MERAKRLASRAYWDLRLFGLPNPVRDFWTLVMTGLVVWSLVGVNQLVARIQQERAAAVDSACRDQNARHDRTIARLRALVADLPPGPRRQRAERSIGGTVALIDALAPRQDCKALVRERVQTAPH